MSQNDVVRKAMQHLGPAMGPEVVARVHAIFDQQQQQLVNQQPALECNIAYGRHERHQLDIYRPVNAENNSRLPVMVFVHGGGFLKGDKGDSHWYNANVGRLAAQRGCLGVVMNYRLAPEHMWPAGGEDVTSCVKWLKGNIAAYGGDASNLILIGTSAGACHVATWHQLNPDSEDVKGLVLLSGLYGITPLDERDQLYYGDANKYSGRMPLPALLNCAIPLFIACTEFDPYRFQQEWAGLMRKRLTAQHRLDRGMLLSGHNHYSIAGHLGTSDTRLADEIMSFIGDCVN